MQNDLFSVTNIERIIYNKVTNNSNNRNNEKPNKRKLKKQTTQDIRVLKKQSFENADSMNLSYIHNLI